jgi:hypothetical protein
MDPAAKLALGGHLPHARYQDAAASAREYLESHKLLQFVQALVHAVLQERPTDPYLFMRQQLESTSSVATTAAEAAPRQVPRDGVATIKPAEARPEASRPTPLLSDAAKETVTASLTQTAREAVEKDQAVPSRAAEGVDIVDNPGATVAASQAGGEPPTDGANGRVAESVDSVPPATTSLEPASSKAAESVDVVDNPESTVAAFLDSGETHHDSANGRRVEPVDAAPPASARLEPPVISPSEVPASTSTASKALPLEPERRSADDGAERAGSKSSHTSSPAVVELAALVASQLMQRAKQSVVHGNQEPPALDDPDSSKDRGMQLMRTADAPVAPVADDKELEDLRLKMGSLLEDSGSRERLNF